MPSLTGSEPISAAGLKAALENLLGWGRLFSR